MCVFSTAISAIRCFCGFDGIAQFVIVCSCGRYMRPAFLRCCRFYFPARKSGSWTSLSDCTFSPTVHSLRFCPRRALPECPPAGGTAALWAAASDAAVFGFPGNHRLDFIFTVSCAQCAETDKAFLPCAFDRSVLSTLDLIALLFQFLQKIFVILGLFCRRMLSITPHSCHDCFLWADKGCASAAPDRALSQ